MNFNSFDIEKKHVSAGSVNSKYSPAAYLYDLWSNAKIFKHTNHSNNLSVRRRDLVDLDLNMDSMENTVSTLSLSNEMLANLCKKHAGFPTDNALLEDISKLKITNYYHQPINILRGVISGLGDNPYLFINKSVADQIYSGISPDSSDSVDNIEKDAQLWALTTLYGITNEDAQVMCGNLISVAETEDSTTGSKIPSQVNRLFNVTTNALPNFTDATQVAKIIIQAFGINQSDLNLLTQLNEIELNTQTVLDDVSKIYAGVLLSRSLGCTIAELIIINQLFIDPILQPHMRYYEYKSVLDWLDSKKLKVSDLLLLISGYSYNDSPAMETLKQELLLEKPASGVISPTTLSRAVSSAFNLPSVNLVESAINWLDADIKKGNNFSQKREDLLSLKKITSARYVLIILPANNFSKLNEVQVFVDSKNIALKKTVTSSNSLADNGDISFVVDGNITTAATINSIGQVQGQAQDQAWLQIDLGSVYEIEGINILLNTKPNSSDILYLYSSLEDMSAQASHVSLGTSTKDLHFLGFSERDGLMLPHREDYINNLLQRISIANSLGLTSDILAMLSSSTAADQIVKQDMVNFTLERLKKLSQIKTLTDACGLNAPALLSDLIKGVLTETKLSQYLNISLTHPTVAPSDSLLKTSEASRIYDIYLFANRTGISLVNLNSLINFTKNSTFSDWTVLAENLMAELSGERFNALQQDVEEKLSNTLSIYYCHIKSDFNNYTIDELSSYLLTDLKTSGSSKTSKVAWAISSVQLYIDRCLNGQELDLNDTTFRDLVFFNDWERYNNRYATWAGLAELKNEPENYIDPALRLSATESFKNLQQQLASTPLNEDSADDLFYSYLTDFEEKSRIATVNAYHDADENTAGSTWFIGQSQNSPKKWFWRKVDNVKLQANLPIKAWSGWSEINIPVNPIFNNVSTFIRPVAFNNRLYVAWIEARDKSIPSKTDPDKTDKSKYCILKLAQQRYDGTWSMPVETMLEVPADVIENSALKLNEQFSNGDYSNFSMYISVDSLAQKLRICVGSSEWYVGEMGVVTKITDVGTYLFPKSLFSQHAAIINGNTALRTVVAYPYTSTDGDISNISVPATAQIGSQEVNINGTFTFSSNDFGFFVMTREPDYDAEWWYKRVECIVNPEGTFISDDVDGSPDRTISGHINNNSFPHPNFKKLSDCFSIIKYDLFPDSWTMRCGTEDYKLSSNFPVQLLQLTESGINAVFALTTLRDNRDGSDPKKLLDFEGALGCYYWELFYHVPMMISLQLQQNQDYIGATKWLGYVYDPNAAICWKPLPLANDEAVAAGDEPVLSRALDTQTDDPDVIAETDPIYYKLATVMRRLDLLISRGDTAYRQLERDTLTEAQMWYLQALHQLGTQPNSSPTVVNSLPTLGKVNVRDFHPQENEKLNGYWELLNHRLFNLRHNLTLDGQPLNLPLFATPVNPEDILLAELSSGSSDTTDLNSAPLGILRFQPALEQARSLVGQLVQFGISLQGIVERQDGEAMSQLLQAQGNQLLSISCDIQDSMLSAVSSDLAALKEQLSGITQRKTYYTNLYNANISANEKNALNMNKDAAILLVAGGASNVIGGVLDSSVPNIYGVADGGNRWGGVANGVGALLANTAFSLSMTAGVLTASDSYSRRRGEWQQQISDADSELKQLTNQISALQARQQAANMQKNYLLTQQRQLGQQLQLLKSKFTNQQLYTWLRSRLSTIYWQFYDIALNSCLRVERACKFEMNTPEQSYIRSGAWQSKSAGLLCGETLLVDLAQMETAWRLWNKRTLEVTRTVSLASILDKTTATGQSGLSLIDAIDELLMRGSTDTYSWKTSGISSLNHRVSMTNKILECHINLAALNIINDYPNTLFPSQTPVRRVKNISVSLPALVGPYQDIRALLTYTDATKPLPVGCDAIAVSHGINDSGQFQLDFNDPHYLPFEGVMLVAPAESTTGTLSLKFPVMDEAQKAILSSLNDIILHIHYTISK